MEKADCEFVVVLHTNKELIQENQGSAEWSKDMNWVADPGFETYKKLGVGRQPLWRALFSWTVLVTAVRGMFHRMFFGRTPLDFFRRSLSDPVRTQVPLDLFIDTRSGLITALGYGPSLSDHKTADWAIEQAKRQ